MKIVTRRIETLTDVAWAYDVIILDQWGVLHNGTMPYVGTIKTLKAVASTGHRLAVLSNSGKRALVNASRITQMGFPADLFETIMTSGEALWNDIKNARIPHQVFFPIERSTGDAEEWATGLDISLTTDLKTAEAMLLMGLPDGSSLAEWQMILERALNRQMTIYCSNPDMSSPRSEGKTVISPGALACDYHKQGGKVVFYGKPYSPVFIAMQNALEAKPNRLLMVGDSLEHDIAGAHDVGWDSLLVVGGIHRDDFVGADSNQILTTMTREKNLPEPTYMIELLQ